MNGMRHAGPRTMRQHIASARRVRDLQQAGNLPQFVDGYVHRLWLRHWVAQVIHPFVATPLGAQGSWPADRDGSQNPWCGVENAMPSVLITSANRGLGFEFAKQYAAEGWQVFAACREPDSASQLRRLADASPGMKILALDVTDLTSVQAAATKLDGRVIDLLLNSAGIIGKPKQTAGNVDYGSWASVLDVNTMGPMRVSEAFVDHVARSDRKLIVTITSGMGSLTDNTSGGSIAYRSSKAAVNMVMRSLAIDLAPRGISCVLVEPRLGAHRHGRRGRDPVPGRERRGAQALDRDARAGAVRQVLPSRRSRIPLVGAHRNWARRNVPIADIGRRQGKDLRISS